MDHLEPACGAAEQLQRRGPGERDIRHVKAKRRCSIIVDIVSVALSSNG